MAEAAISCSSGCPLKTAASGIDNPMSSVEQGGIGQRQNMSLRLFTARLDIFTLGVGKYTNNVYPKFLISPRRALIPRTGRRS